MKKYIFLVFLCLTLVVKSQVSCYVIGGTSHGVDLNSSSQPGFNAGALIDMPLAKSWSFQTGLQFNTISTDSNWEVLKNVKGKMVAFDDGMLRSFKFLELPVAISTSIKLSENTKLKFNAGGYFSLFVGGETLYRKSSGFGDYTLGVTEAYPVGGGFLFGTGLEINKIYLGVEGNYNIPDGYIPNALIKTKFGKKF